MKRFVEIIIFAFWFALAGSAAPAAHASGGRQVVKKAALKKPGATRVGRTGTAGNGRVRFFGWGRSEPVEMAEKGDKRRPYQKPSRKGERSEHTKGERGSTKDKHEKGQTRKDRDSRDDKKKGK